MALAFWILLGAGGRDLESCGAGRVRHETESVVLPAAELATARLPLGPEGPRRAYRWMTSPRVGYEGRCGCCERVPEPAVEDWDFYRWPP